MAKNNKNVVGFKKFSNMKKSKVEEVDLSRDITPDDDSDIPMNPNLPKKTKKTSKYTNDKKIRPVHKTEHDDHSNNEDGNDDNEELNDTSESKKNVKTYGKVAKFPKNVNASKAYNFLENVKVSKKSIWYIMVEKQDDQLQMVKYNYKEGVNLNNFVNELKTYYMDKYSDDKKVCEKIQNISVDGTDKYSMVKNIPLVEVEGKKMITQITEDLIKLLSK